jgi:uncharacterized repeat protein (TIGR03803 family)
MRHFTRLLVLLLLAWGSCAAARSEDIQFQVLASFAFTNGSEPWAPLVQGADGNFYGTTYYGGPNPGVPYSSGSGTVFKLTTNGNLTALSYFYGTNGSRPRSGLVQAKDGNLYGTTHNGGTSTDIAFSEVGYGTVFRISPTGEFTSLLSFVGTNGACPAAELVEGPDGWLYGTTRAGGSTFNVPRFGANGYGSVFRISTNGEFALVYSFTPDSIGVSPMSALLAASDGNLYGDCETVAYRLTTSGVYDPIALLDSSHAYSHLSKVCEGRDGLFYLVCHGVNSNSPGQLFSFSTNGNLSTLSIFPASITFSWGGAVEGTDGSFFGTSASGGTNDAGTIYRVSPDGVFTTLVSLNNSNGAAPQARLIQGVDGAFYGTTMYGGDFNYGAIVRVSVSSAMAPKLRPPARSGGETTLNWSAIGGRRYQVQTVTNVAASAWNDTGPIVVATNSLNACSILMSSAPQMHYRVIMLP